MTFTFGTGPGGPWIQTGLGKVHVTDEELAQACQRNGITLGQAPSQRVRLDVHCGEGCGTHLGTWYDTIDEKYPFWCDNCGDYSRKGSYPWKLTATIEAAP